MGKENRKLNRSQCLFPAEIVQANGKQLIERVSIHDFSKEGFKLVINLNLNPSSILESKIYVPEKKIATQLVGEIVWSKFADNRFEIGLKIREMDEKAKNEILEWVAPNWAENSV